jgi:triacylglycerol lipase
MVAWLQRVIVAVLFAGAAASIFYASAIARPSLAGVGALVIVVGYALLMGAEFAVLHFVQNSDAAVRPEMAQLFVAWWGEITTAPQVFLWRQPFRSNHRPDYFPEPDKGGQRRGVVLVHGFFCNRGLWNPWTRQMHQSGVPFIAVNLEPLLGSIDLYHETIEAAVARMQAATGRPPVMVGHSMGGLAIRAWSAKHRGADRVHRVITIGTPHHGTWLARHARAANARQMQLSSDWLSALAEVEAAMTGVDEVATPYKSFTCFYGHCDNIVFPSATATLNGACNIHLPGTAHVQMAYHPAVFAETMRWLN